MTHMQMILTVAVVVAATMLTRFLPYMVFSEGREIPKIVRYLGKVLAPAVFGMLVVYCLKNVNFTGGTFGLPELISLAAITVLYVWKRDMLVPMAGGTILYMILIRVM
ncbi:MAG: AzlD domain-containing protein [Lachnospiraceae bacterium]|nr:AzlD domain-containing protein [Lachnospiraceae bacterium]